MIEMIISAILGQLSGILMPLIGGAAAIGIAWFMGGRSAKKKAKIKQLEETIEVERNQKDLENETAGMSDEALDDAIEPWIRD